MNRFLLAVLLLLPLRVWAAVGDVTGMEVSPSGWSARMWVSGLNTNGIINAGLTGSNVASLPRIKLQITSMGYNADGSGTTVLREVIGTHLIRHAWSNAAAAGPPGPFTNQIATDGAGCVVSFSLSDYVCARDSNIVATLLTGAYAVTNGTGTNSVAGTLSIVTNASGQPYPKSLAFPLTVPWQVVGGSQYQIDIVAANYFAAGGKPVKSVHFWGVDADAHRSPTNVVTDPIVDFSKPTPTIVYRSFVWQTNFTAGVAGTNFTNFVKVFPRIGDSSSIWDSSDGTYDGDSPYLGPQVFFSNRNGDYSICFACVDRTNGFADGNIYTNLASLIAAPRCFTNIQLALNTMAVTNLTLFNKSNWDNCVILLTNGRHGFVSDPDAPTVTTRLLNRSWITISNYPGVAMVDAVICTNRGATSVQKLSRIKFVGLTLDWIANAAFDSQGRSAIWWDRCDIRTNEIGNTGAISVNNTNIWMTGCTVGRNRYGFKPSGTPNTKEPLLDRWHVWGNRFSCYTESMNPITFIGNIILPATNGPSGIKNDTAGSGFDPWCYSFNQVLRGDASALPLSIGLATNVDIGALVIQNVLEVATNGSNPPFDVMQSTRDLERSSNIIVWNNTILARYHPPFNHSSNTVQYSALYSHVGNLIDDFEIDTDGSLSGATQNADNRRTNRWNLIYGVGTVGNAYAELNAQNGNPESQGTTGSYGFIGLSTGYWATNNSGNVWKYVRFASMVGTTTGNGNGNYRLQSHSTLFNDVPLGMAGWVLPYDIDGRSRGPTDPPGAFTSGNAKQAPVF